MTVDKDGEQTTTVLDLNGVDSISDAYFLADGRVVVLAFREGDAVIRDVVAKIFE